MLDSKVKDLDIHITCSLYNSLERMKYGDIKNYASWDFIKHYYYDASPELFLPYISPQVSHMRRNAIVLPENTDYSNLDTSYVAFSLPANLFESRSSIHSVAPLVPAVAN